MWYLPQQHRLRASSVIIIITLSAFMITMTMTTISNNNACCSLVAAQSTTVSPQAECESVDGGVFDPYSGACLTTIPRASLLAPCDEATSLARCGCTTCALPGCAGCITRRCGGGGGGSGATTTISSSSGGGSSSCPAVSCVPGWSTQFGQFPCKSLDSAGIEGADKQAAIDASMLGGSKKNNNFMNDVYASSGVLLPVIPTTAVQVNSPEYFRQKSVNDEQYFSIFGNSNNNNNNNRSSTSAQTKQIVQIVVNWVPPVSLTLFGFFAVYYLISRA